MRAGVLLLAIACAPAIARAAPIKLSTATPHPGIVHERWADAAVPMTLDLVRIDLTSAEIAIRATPEALKGRTTSAFAAGTDGAVVAVNGGPFAVAGYAPRGLAMGDGALWSQTADDATTATLELGREGEQTTAAIVPPETIVMAADLAPTIQGVVSGAPLLVRAGVVATGFDCADADAIACTRAPRTAVGVSADGHTLLVVVVDGWQSASLGMTAAELGTFLAARGAATAVALGGGSSSTLWLDGAVANHPSDGAPRAVANHLAVTYAARAKGEMYGVICSGMLSNCTEVGHGGRISGATVTLDDGRVLTSSSSGCPSEPACGSYDFTQITPRYACVTVKKAGYLTARKCEQVASSTIVYNSIVLTAGTDAIDAGVPDATETVTADGSPATGADAGVGSGGGGSGGGGGCCDAGGRDGGAAVVIAGWFAWGWRRRRRDTTRGIS